MEEVAKKGLKEGEKKVSRLNDSNDYAVAWVMQNGLGGHAIPLDGPSIRVLEKCGFSREGLARRYLCINGIWQDHLLFGLLHEDFRG